jgi:hypothetical protein
MKSYSIQLPSGKKFTCITETPAAEIPEAIRERFRVYPDSVVDLTAPTSSFYLK